MTGVIKFIRHMPKSDVFLWLKVKCYSEVSTKKILTNSKQISDKRKYKKIHLRGKKRKAWNRGKQTQMPFSSTEGVAATDKV